MNLELVIFFKSLKSSIIEFVLIITSMSLLMNNIITYNKQALRSQAFDNWQINFKVVNNLFNYLPKKKTAKNNIKCTKVT